MNPPDDTERKMWMTLFEKIRIILSYYSKDWKPREIKDWGNEEIRSLQSFIDELIEKNISPERKQTQNGITLIVSGKIGKTTIERPIYAKKYLDHWIAENTIYDVLKFIGETNTQNFKKQKKDILAIAAFYDGWEGYKVGNLIEVSDANFSSIKQKYVKFLKSDSSNSEQKSDLSVQEFSQIEKNKKNQIQSEQIKYSEFLEEKLSEIYRKDSKLIEPFLSKEIEKKESFFFESKEQVIHGYQEIAAWKFYIEKYSEAQEFAKKAINLGSQDTWTIHIALSANIFELNFSEAKNIIESEISKVLLNEDFFFPFRLLNAILLWNLNQTEKALQIYEEYKYRKEVNFWTNTFLVYESQSKLPISYRIRRATLRENIDFMNDYLASCWYLVNKNFEQSLKSIDDAIFFNESNRLAWDFKTQLFRNVKISEHYYRKLIDDFEFPNNDSSDFFILAKHFTIINKREDALKALKLALEKDEKIKEKIFSDEILNQYKSLFS